MDSPGSNDKALLDGSGSCDLDLVMDLGSDLDDIDIGPSSPVLHSSMKRCDGSQQGKPSPVLISSSQSASFPNKLQASDINCAIIGTSAVESLQEDARNTSPLLSTGRRTIQLRTQAKNVNCPGPSSQIRKVKCDIIGNEVHAPKRPLPANFLPQEKIKRLKPCVTKPDILPSNDTQSDAESDIISLYARDDDGSTLYSNNAIRDVPVSSAGVSTDGKNQRTVVLSSKEPSSSDSTGGKFQDLRYKIPKAKSSTDNVHVSNIMELLNKNTRSQTLVAADMFCKTYMDNQIHKVTKHFSYLTRKLAGMLLSYNEMKHLYRIVRLSIDMHIVLSDQVLCGLIEYMGQNLDSHKVSVILNQIKEKSLMCGDAVFRVANKFLNKHDTTANFQTGQDSFHGAKSSKLKRTASRNLFARRTAVQGRTKLAAPGSEEQQREDHSGSILKFPYQTRMLNDGAPRSSSFCSKGPLYVKIENVKTDTAVRKRFGCVPRDKDSTQQVDDILHVPDQNSPGRTSGNSSVDLNMLGKCIAQLAKVVGCDQKADAFFLALAGIITSAMGKECDQKFLNEGRLFPELKTFMQSALENATNRGSDDVTRIWLSWIGSEICSQLSTSSAYVVAKVLRDMKLNIVPPLKSGTPAEKRARFESAKITVTASLEQNDVELAMHAVDEYFVGKNYDPGPVLSPMLCKMLCSVAKTAQDNRMFLTAGKCLGMLPLGYGDGSECSLMEDVLLGILTGSEFESKEEEAMCNGMVEQMLARSMATEIRTVIVKAFCVNVVPVFKYLEGKGVYRRPQIAQSPHLIVMPYLLSMEEMALVVQRHLTELCEFLMEMNEKIRMQFPLRIILSKNTGSLQALLPVKSTNFSVAYDDGLKRVTETITSILKPKLVISSKEIHPDRQEYIIIVSTSSVKSWMLVNTDYEETSRTSCVRG